MYNQNRARGIPIRGGNGSDFRTTSRSLDTSMPYDVIPEEFEYKLHPTPIGKGSYSTVYLGYDKDDNKVAVKKISVRKLPEDRLEKFLLELDISKDLDHKNIVKCYKTLQTRRHWYVVTEYCDAGTLKDFIKELNSLEPSVEKENKIREVMIQLRSALRYMKERNLLHRDLKPMNILFTQDENTGEFILKLADFGFSRYFNSAHISKDGYDSMIGTICGSPIYMAPEMLLLSSYNIKADLWSFGVILYEMLYKCNPYNFPKSIPQLRDLIMSQKIVFYDTYSPLCMNLIKSLLVVDPKSRIDWDTFLNHPWFDLVTPENSMSINTSTTSIHEKIMGEISDITDAITTNNIDDSIMEQHEDYVVVKANDCSHYSGEIYESYAHTGSFIKIVSGLTRIMNYFPGLSKSV